MVGKEPCFLGPLTESVLGGVCLLTGQQLTPITSFPTLEPGTPGSLFSLLNGLLCGPGKGPSPLCTQSLHWGTCYST